MTTLPKLLAMGQITPPLEDRWILTYTPAAKYDRYLGFCYDTQQATALREKGFLLVRGWVQVSGPVPPEWQMIQPGGA